MPCLRRGVSRLADALTVDFILALDFAYLLRTALYGNRTP